MCTCISTVINFLKIYIVYLWFSFTEILPKYENRRFAILWKALLYIAMHFLQDWQKFWKKIVIPGLIKLSTIDWSMNLAYKTKVLRIVFTYCHEGSLCCYTLYMSNSNINLKALCIPHGEERMKFLREKKLKYWILKLFYLTTSSLKTYFFINRILYPITGDVTSILYRYPSDNTHQIQKKWITTKQEKRWKLANGRVVLKMSPYTLSQCIQIFTWAMTF
jgi:hypothetical protein